jgi:hypothetical protein
MARVTVVATKPRQLVAEFALVRTGDGAWVGLRDVVEVDGKAISDRRDRPVSLMTNAAAVLLNQGSIDTARLPPGRCTAMAIPILGDQPLGRVSRVFEIDDK